MAGSDSDNMLGDVMEALIGACFVEQGFDAARDMVRRLWAEAVDGQDRRSAKHPKSALQEWAAGNQPQDARIPAGRPLRAGPRRAIHRARSASTASARPRPPRSSKQDAETAGRRGIHGAIRLNASDNSA